MNQEHHILASWDANADAWTRAVRQAKIESRRLATDAAIVSAVKRHRPTRVLDVGCGEGWLARALAGEGMHVVGVDGSTPLIEQARQLGGATFLALTYDEIAAHPEQLGPPYDAVVCNFALLGQSLAPLMRALASCLAPQGTLFIQTVHPFTACGDGPYQDGWRTETFASFGGEFRQAMPWYFRTVGAWLDLIAQSGLRLAECVEPLHPESRRPLSLLLIGQRE
jgi:2-polyprenyl-3-methyl-5-hydroxy-6-metoxy-1,4-benzoquinol methylase